MDTHVAAPGIAAGPSSSLEMAGVAIAPPHEPAVGRWPGWARLAILIGGSAALWGGIGWIAFRVLKMS